MHVRLCVLTTVNCETTVYWDITPCSLVERYQHCGGTGYFHRQSRIWGPQVPLKYWYLSTHVILNEKFWEELIAYFP
jgi:hypothetical protein